MYVCVDYLSLISPRSTPSAISFIAVQISSREVYEKHTFKVALKLLKNTMYSESCLKTVKTCYVIMQ